MSSQPSTATSELPAVRLRNLLARSSVRRHLVMLLCTGCSRKEIAARLGRSMHTVDGHLKALYAATGVHDRALLILLAREVLSGASDCSEHVRMAPPPPPESGG